MRIYLQAGFGAPLGAEALDLIASLGFAGIRQDVSASLPSPLDAVVGEFRGRPLAPLFVVGAGAAPASEVVHRARYVAHAASRLGLRAYSIEVGNEPDATSSQYAGRPAAWGHLVRQVAEALPNVHVVSGGITSTSVQALDYLRAALAEIPDSVTVGVHTYRDSHPDKPLPGFGSRLEEFATLRAVVGSSRPVWGTEVGWHDGRRSWWPCVKPLSGAEVATRLTREFGLCAAARFEVATLYQLNDGTGRDEHFGIRRLDGSLKPSAYVARELQTQGV